CFRIYVSSWFTRSRLIYDSSAGPITTFWWHGFSHPYRDGTKHRHDDQWDRHSACPFMHEEPNASEIPPSAQFPSQADAQWAGRLETQNFKPIHTTKKEHPACCRGGGTRSSNPQRNRSAEQHWHPVTTDQCHWSGACNNGRR